MSIGILAFKGCKALTTFTISEGVTSLEVGNQAFEDCKALTIFPIPKSVTSLLIKGWIFAGCLNLKTITIPDRVESIELGSDMLSLSSVEKLLIPKRLEDKTPEDFERKDKIDFYGKSTQQ